MISDTTIYIALANLHGRKVKEIADRFKISRKDGLIYVYDDFRDFVVCTKEQADEIRIKEITHVIYWPITSKYWMARIR